MTQTDIKLEKFFRDIVAARPQRKFEETITKFDRRIFWYDRDELSRQSDYAETLTDNKVTYEDHRRAIETAVNLLHANTQHEIAMEILSHRFFKAYRAKVFAGAGSFKHDYSFLIKKIAMVFNANSGRIKPVNINRRLQEFKTPTLVQINHITGDVNVITPPGNKFTLNEWASRYNFGAPPSTTYRLTGLSLK